MFTRVNTFKTTTELFASCNPFAEPAPWMQEGAYFGVFTGSNRRFFLDPVQLKNLGLTDSSIVMLYAGKNHGKSVFLKDLVIKTSALQSGKLDDPSNMPPVRVRINDRKENENANHTDGGRLYGEFSDVTNHMYGETVHLGSLGRINPFDPNMQFDRATLDMLAISIAQDVFERSLQNYEELAVQVAVDRMIRAGHSAYSVETLLWYLNRPSRDMLEAYMRLLETTPIANAPDTAPVILDNKSIFQSYCEDSARVGGAYATFLGGKYGCMFGGTEGLYDLLKPDTVSIDWTGVSGKGADFLEGLIYNQQAVALRMGYPINPHIMLSDEEGSKIKNLVHAKLYALYVREARKYSFVDFKATQFGNDMSKVGNEGSELRQTAREIDAGVGVRIYGRQPSDDDILHAITQHGVSAEEARQTTTLPQGCWGIKVKDRPMQFVQHIVSDTVLELAETNRASKRVSARQEVSTMPHIVARLEQIERLKRRSGANQN
jgi:hypothetical protein